MTRRVTRANEAELAAQLSAVCPQCDEGAVRAALKQCHWDVQAAWSVLANFCTLQTSPMVSEKRSLSADADLGKAATQCDALLVDLQKQECIFTSGNDQNEAQPSLAMDGDLGAADMDFFADSIMHDSSMAVRNIKNKLLNNFGSDFCSFAGKFS